MKSIKTWAVALMAAFAMTSCIGGDDDGGNNTTTLIYTSCLNYVVDNPSGVGGLYNDPKSTTTMGYSLTFDFDKKTASVGIANLSLSNEIKNLYFDLYDMPLKADGGSLKVSAYNIIPKVGGVPASGYMIDQFVMTFTDRVYNGAYMPVVTISYTINGRYKVEVMPMENIYFGNTKVTTIASGEEYDTTDPYYRVSLKQDKTTAEVTADVYVYNAKFSSAMPVQSEMVFKNAALEFNSAGFNVSASRIVPEIKNTPYERFMITGLSAQCKNATGMDISYDVAGTWNVDSKMRYFNLSLDEK